MDHETQQVWQDLRGMRAAPVGHAAADPTRRAVFSASLRQAQELALAASVAGYATKPLLLYYAYNQGIRAAAAAVLDAPWRVNGHGAQVTANANVLETRIRRKPLRRDGSRDSLRQLQALEGRESFTANMTLEQVWAAWESPALVSAPRRLRIEPKFEPSGLATPGWVRVEVEGLPSDLTSEGFADEMQHYSTLVGMEPDKPNPGDDVTLTEGGLYARESPRHDETYSAILCRIPISEESQRYRQLRPGYVSPRIGGAALPQRESVFWCLLYALSSLVRYEPDLWVATIDTDHSRLAVPFEKTCDSAENQLPRDLRALIRLPPRTEEPAVN